MEKSTVDTRAFVLILADFKHEKYGDEYPVALLNRKMLMPSKYKAWQGKLGLFGGKVEPGETPVRCAHRELREELGLSFCEQEGFVSRADIVFRQNSIQLGGYRIFKAHLNQYSLVGGESEHGWHCRAPFNQKGMTHLAGKCTEGLLDVFSLDRLKRTSPDEFLSPELYQIVQGHLLFAHWTRVCSEPGVTPAHVRKDFLAQAGINSKGWPLSCGVGSRASERSIDGGE
jgi:ADP-ribose pyrophosphatase YjhB (NUDIX family)